MSIPWESVPFSSQHKGSKLIPKITMPKPHKSTNTNSSSHSYHNQFNSGPFSPNIFTKRVWIKKSNGTPTTLIVHQGDIIDDLKVAIMNKFPNSLARSCDPADLLVKMDLQARQQNNIQPSDQARQQNTLSTKLGPGHSSVSPDNIKGSVLQNSYKLINLEPDQIVWSLLDMYYPNGMSMKESLIVESPFYENLAESTSTHNLHSNVISNSNSVRTSFSSPNNSHQGLNQSLSTVHQGINTSNSGSIKHPQPQQPSKATTPISSHFNSQSYYNQTPQYSYQYNSNSSPSLIKDRSVSPSTMNLKQSPAPTGPMHRRSQSNPPNSPVSEASQAVLLLPKNFSLAAGGSQYNNYQTPSKKRLSLDENFVLKSSSSATHKSGLSTNLTNIGIGINSPDSNPTAPFSMSVKKREDLPRLDTMDGESEGAISSGTSANDDKRIDKTQLSLTLSPATPLRDQTNMDRAATETHLKPNKELPPKLPLEKQDNIQPFKEMPVNKNKKPTKTTKSTIEKVLPSISVLVVEDNAINQAILGAFLRKHKIHYQIAKNGQEAIDKWRTGGFHLVLMDIQLPVKSGIEATKEIRHLEKINRIGVFAQNEYYLNPMALLEEEKLELNVFRSPVIIVALTASSNSSVDKKNALMAGCNDYLTKPVNLVWLQNKITEWGCMQALIDFDGWKDKRLPIRKTS